jgi:hypothetical protein
MKNNTQNKPKRKRKDMNETAFAVCQQVSAWSNEPLPADLPEPKEGYCIVSFRQDRLAREKI